MIDLLILIIAWLWIMPVAAAVAFASNPTPRLVVGLLAWPVWIPTFAARLLGERHRGGS